MYPFTFGSLIVLLSCSVSFGQGPYFARPSSSPVDRLMTYDKNEDQTLTVEEVEDTRVARIIKKVDSNSDGEATQQELSEYFDARTREIESSPPPSRGFARPGFGPPPAMFGRPGQVLPEFLRQGLNLTSKQSEELAQLQSYVDQQLAEILTKQQQFLTRPRTPRYDSN